jgi:hypothetical protein
MLFGLGMVSTGACGLLLAIAAPAQTQGGGCAACVGFVTTYDPDGSGSTAPTTRLHSNLLATAATWYALDVDGTKAPTSILPPVLGLPPVAPADFEIAVNVTALNADKPTITIERPVNVPPRPAGPLPLRIELVRGSSAAGWTSLGYDALSSEAPRKLVADVDLTNRDANTQTDQAFLDARITDPPSGAGKPFVLVSEKFGGDPAGTRTKRRITRLEYSGNGNTTRIPGRVTADVTSPAPVAGAPQRQRVILTRDAATNLDFEVSEPGKSTTGTVEELPARIDVTIADTPATLGVDVDQDDDTDANVPANKKTIDYDKATSVARKVVIESREGEDRTKATIDDLPKDAVLTYTTPKFPADPNAPRDPNLDRAPTNVTYHADGGATRAQLESDSVSVVDGVREESNLTADLHSVPRNVNELTHTPVFGADPPGDEAPEQVGDKVAYHADGRATQAHLTFRSEGVEEGVARVSSVDADARLMPANITELSFTSSDGASKLHYDSDARADELTVDANVRTGSTEQRTHTHVVGLPADIDLTSVSASGENHVDYTSDTGAERADFKLVDDSDVDAGGATDRTITIDADSDKADGQPGVSPQLPNEIHVDAVKPPGKLEFDYSASAPVERVLINGAHLRGLPDRINNLNVVLDRVPKALAFDTLTKETVERTTIIECYVSEKCPEDLPDCDFEEVPLPPECQTIPTTTTTKTKEQSDITITSPDGRLGSAAVQLSSTGAPDEEHRLPARVEDHPDHPPQDGVLIHDADGRYVIDARLTELEKAFVSQRSDSLRATHFDRAGNPSHRFPWFDNEWMDIELIAGSTGHALAFVQGDKKALLAKLPGGLLTANTSKQKATEGYGFPNFQTLDWSSDGTVDGYTRVDGTRAPGFSLVDGEQVLEVDPMPTTLTVCKTDLGNSCTKPIFDHNLERLASGDNDRSDCGIEDNCLTGHNVPMDIDPQLANKGSLLLTADPKTHFLFQDGPDTLVDFHDLAHFALQAHKITPSCGTFNVDCPRGYVAMDTGGNTLKGVLKQGTGDEQTRFDFPPIDGNGESRFNSNQYVWSFMKTGALQGYVAGAGSIDCPDGTSIRAGGEIITERFCYGDLLDNDVPGV